MSKTDLQTIVPPALLYLVLEPFKWQRTLIKPALGPADAPVYIQLTAEEAAPLIADGLVSGDDPAMPAEYAGEIGDLDASDVPNTNDDDVTAEDAGGQQGLAAGGQADSVADTATELQGGHSADSEGQANAGDGNAAAADQSGQSDAAPGGESAAGDAVKEAPGKTAKPAKNKGR